MGRRRRYAIVGTGARAAMFLDAIAGPYRDTAEVVGWDGPSASARPG